VISLKWSFAEIGVELAFEGEGVNEIARISRCNNEEYQLKEGSPVLKIDPKYFRPTEVDLLIGDPTKARKNLDGSWIMTSRDLLRI
jgi:GDPmannose 4,6-dehydratase